MNAALRSLFSRVSYTCRDCGTKQRIPVRRIHVFERFHRLERGEPVLIACPQCHEGLLTPSPYRTHTGHEVRVDPDSPPENAVIHDAY